MVVTVTDVSDVCGVTGVGISAAQEVLCVAPSSEDNHLVTRREGRSLGLFLALQTTNTLQEKYIKQKQTYDFHVFVNPPGLCLGVSNFDIENPLVFACSLETFSTEHTFRVGFLRGKIISTRNLVNFDFT